MTTLLWWGGAIIAFVVAVHVPWLGHRQLKVLEVTWREPLKPPVAIRVKLAYRWRQAQIWGVMMVVWGMCCSWLVMSGLYSGAITWLASIVGACG